MEIQQILKLKKLSRTSSRLDILEVFLENNTGLTEKEISEKTAGKYDRATIYRTLKAFREKEIIHPVVAENEMTRYVIRKETGDHIHFKCQNCGNVFCLTQLQISDLDLPPGFIKREINFLVTGICPGCN